jgi:hypothetical protein
MWVWWFKGDGLGHRWKCIVVVGGGKGGLG